MDQFIMQLLALDNSVVVTVLFYSICFLVGLFLHSGIEDFRGYSLGGKPFYMITIGATTIATIIGAEYTFGFSEQLYNVGFVSAIMFLGGFFEKYIIAYALGPRISKFKNVYTMGEIWREFYNSKSSQILNGLVAVLTCTLSIAMQIAVFGYMTEAFFGINGNLGAVFSTVMITMYCYAGGIRAVVTTDVIQLVVIMIVFPIICYLAVSNYGGMALLIENITSSQLSIVAEHPKLKHYLLMMLLYIIPCFDPAEFHRLLIAQTAYRIKRSMKLAAIIGLVFYVIIGVLTSIAFLSNQELSGNQVLIYTIQNFISPDIAIAGYLAIIAVIMSTTDSYLNTSSVILIKDVIEPICGRFGNSLKQVRAARLSTVFIGVLSCYLALTAESIMELVYNFIDLWYPTVVIPMYACLFNIKTSFKVVIKSMAIGVIMLITWQYFDLESTTSVMPVIPSMLANVAAFALFRYAERRQPLAHLEANMSELQYGVKDIDNKCNLIGTNLLDGEIEFNENDIFKLQQLEAQARLVTESLNHTIKRAKRLNEVERLKNIELETKDHLVRAKAEVSEEV